MMDWSDCFNRLDLKNKFVLYEKIHAIPNLCDFLLSIDDRNCHLCLDAQSTCLQFTEEACFIRGFEKPRPKLSMNGVCGIHNDVRELIEPGFIQSCLPFFCCGVGCEWRGGHRSLPAQHRLTRSSGLIQSADTCRVRSSLDQLRVLRCFACNLLQGVYEEIKFFAGFALSWFDHHGTRDDEREAYRVGVEAVVDEAFAHVSGLDAVLCL